jgi:beta-barrel assembly-enhancing protease
MAGTAAAQGVNFYSLERELALGEQLARNFQRNVRPVETPAALAYVEAIGRRLTAEIDGPAFEYRFALFVAARDGTRLSTRTELMNFAAIPLETTGGAALSLLQMQRKSELAADLTAARAMANAGYDPEALARYVERVQPAEEARAGIWSPMPRRSTRVEAIRNLGLAPQPHEPRTGLTTAQDDVRKSIR